MYTLKDEEILYYKKSAFNDIAVTRKGSKVTLRSPFKTKQTTIDLENPYYPCLEYTKYMLYCLAFNPKPYSTLCLGLGGGAIPSILAGYSRDIFIDVVEIDPEIAYVAIEFFNFQVNNKIKLFIEPCEKFVTKVKSNYDFIIHDAYIGNKQSRTLTTKKFYMKLSDRLSPEGVLICNLISKEGDTYNSILDTIGTVFPYIYVLPSETTHNVTLFCNHKHVSTLDLAGQVEHIQNNLNFTLDPNIFINQFKRPPIMSRLKWYLKKINK